MFELTTFNVLAGGAIGVVALGAFILLFRLGCILADVTDPTVGGSILVVAVLFLVTIPLGGVVGYYLLAAESVLAAQSGLIFYSGLGAYVVVVWLLAALVYAFFLGSSFKKGLIVAGIQLLLFALLVALLSALVLVVLAVLQIANRPEAPRQSSLSPPAQVRVSGPTPALRELS
jgi:hypothetical protein